MPIKKLAITEMRKRIDVWSLASLWKGKYNFIVPYRKCMGKTFDDDKSTIKH